MNAQIDRNVIGSKLLTEQLHAEHSSALQRYQAKAIGNSRLVSLLQYELYTTFFGNLGGAAGYVLRKQAYRRLFRHMGQGAIIGKGVVIRHPCRISVGNHIAVDDYAILDASGAGEDGIEIEDNVIISRNCVIQGKSGPVFIGEHSDIGCNTIITPATSASIGASVLIGGNSYIGGARYITDRLDIPMMQQGKYSNGPVVIEDDVWLGASTVVLDGVHIGKGCIIGAGAVVTKDIPAFSIAVGIPAKVVKTRLNTEIDG